ncbi:MFS transporter [Candidatus Pantoea formicae]|uniref:MFS transporter n=1 Tax=Candidatus Pantoea formicae TaxID=2608355 RepID=UPI003ED9ACD9
MFSLALLAVTTTLILLPQCGALSLTVFIGLATTLLAGALFFRHTQRIAHPVFTLALLRQPHFAGVLLLPVATCYCYVVLLIVIPLFLIGARDLSETQSAVILLALTAPMLIFPGVAAWLTRWFNPGKISVAGLLLATLGLIGMAHAIKTDGLIALACSMFVTGMGAALPWGLMDGLAVSAVSVERAGMAAGLFNTVRVAGEGMALAIVMALLALFNRLGLQQSLPILDTVTRDKAAVWLSGSHVLQAHELLPQIPVPMLINNVEQAYFILLYGLAAITLGCAVWVGILLKQPVNQA